MCKTVEKPAQSGRVLEKVLIIYGIDDFGKNSSLLLSGISLIRCFHHFLATISNSSCKSLLILPLFSLFSISRA